MTDICHRCEETREIFWAGLCEDCSTSAAEAAAERLYEGEPPVSVTERAQLANQERRRGRGY